MFCNVRLFTHTAHKQIFCNKLFNHASEAAIWMEVFTKFSKNKYAKLNYVRQIKSWGNKKKLGEIKIASFCLKKNYDQRYVKAGQIEMTVSPALL